MSGQLYRFKFTDSSQSVQMFDQADIMLPVPVFAQKVKLTVGEVSI